MKLYPKYFLVFACLLFAKFNFSQEKISVHYFLLTTCPISQKYTYVINQIAEKYSSNPIQFGLIFLDIKNKKQKEEVEMFIQKYQLTPSYIAYPNTNIANKFGATVTPEVVVMKGTEIMYQGAIDDWFISWGKNKKKAEQHYLINALDALLANTPIWIKKTNAIGCSIETNLPTTL